MGKAKWWVCDSCHSLNDLPANKCYKCRESKPANPRLMDDTYSEVGGQQRVGITVDLSHLGDLVRPDPLETEEGGGIIEAFRAAGERSASDPPQAQATPVSAPYDPYAPKTPQPSGTSTPGPRPMREPVRRGIDALGGQREWADDPAGVTPPLPPAQSAGSAAVTPPPGAIPPPGAVPPSGQVPHGPTQVPPPAGYVPPPAGYTPAPPPGQRCRLRQASHCHLRQARHCHLRPASQCRLRPARHCRLRQASSRPAGLRPHPDRCHHRGAPPDDRPCHPRHQVPRRLRLRKRRHGRPPTTTRPKVRPPPRRCCSTSRSCHPTGTSPTLERARQPRSCTSPVSRGWDGASGLTFRLRRMGACSSRPFRGPRASD